MNEKIIRVAKTVALVSINVALAVYNQRQKVKHDMLMAEIAIQSHELLKKTVEVVVKHDDVLMEHDDKLSKMEVDLKDHLETNKNSKKKKA